MIPVDAGGFGGTGPVGTTWPDLAYQGGFRVFKGGEAFDDIFETSEAYPEGSLKARQRISWVEIESSLDAVDVGRVHFVDPERKVAGYVAKIWSESDTQMLEQWTVKIGYHFLPEDRWVSFSGVPVIEDTIFPRDGPPEVTIRLFAPSIAMLRKNSYQTGKPTRHFAHEPHSIMKALQTMADAYGVKLFTGSLSRVIELLDKLAEEGVKSPSDFLSKYRDAYALNNLLEGFSVRYNPNAVTFMGVTPRGRIMDAISTFGQSFGSDRNDWQYLLLLREKLQPLTDALFEGEASGDVNDNLWSRVSRAGNKIVFGIRGMSTSPGYKSLGGSAPALYFCRLRDLYDDLDEVVVYSYQCLEHSLLSFRVLIDSSKGGTNVGSAWAEVLAKREAAITKSETDDASTEVTAGADDPEARYEVSPSAPAYDPAITKPAGTYSMRIATAARPEHFQEIPEKELLGELATNLRGEAEIIGSPFLCAGRLMGTYGLGQTSETKPEPPEIPKIAPLDRVWFITNCLHRVDSTGTYITTCELAGASTDDSTKVPAALADMLSKSLERTGGEEKILSPWQKFIRWLGLGG